MSKEYFNTKGFFSNSFLKALSESPKSAHRIIKGEQGDEKSPALSFGSLVDCLLTTPELFNEDYIIYRGKAPTDKLLDVATEYIRIYQLEGSTEGFDANACIISAQHNVGYDGRLKPETMIKRFEDDCKEYCTFVLNYRDKIIVDETFYNEANRITLETKASPYLQHIFNPDSNLIVLFQVPIFVNTTKFSGKILIDCLVIDLVDKRITPYDFKTFEGSFESNYWKYKYYYQEAWYSWILHILCNPDLFVDCNIPEQLKIIHSGGYSIEQFKFIAIDKSGYKNVEIFKSYPKIIEDVFFNGYIDKGSVKIPIKSIESLIEETKWRISNDSWSDDYQMITNGVKKLWL